MLPAWSRSRQSARAIPESASVREYGSLREHTFCDEIDDRCSLSCATRRENSSCFSRLACSRISATVRMGIHYSCRTTVPMSTLSRPAHIGLYRRAGQKTAEPGRLGARASLSSKSKRTLRAIAFAGNSFSTEICTRSFSALEASTQRSRRPRTGMEVGKPFSAAIRREPRAGPPSERPRPEFQACSGS